MKLKMLGVNFPHKKNEFCKKTVTPFFVVCCFSTPFLYTYDEELREGCAGDILINSPGNVVYHGPTNDLEQGFINDWFHIEGEDFAKLLTKYPLPLNQAFSVGKNFFIRRYATKLLREFQNSQAGTEDVIDCLITEMVIDIFRAYSGAYQTDEQNNSISIVKSEILKNPGKNWTLAEMAKISGYSASRFSELYFSKYGISPINDVINERLNLAKHLLVSGQTSIGNVANLCGFNSVYYFSKCFKKNVGCTPTEYIIGQENGNTIDF